MQKKKKKKKKKKQTYSHRNSKPQQKHLLGTISKNTLCVSGVCVWGGGGEEGAGGGEWEGGEDGASIDFTWRQPRP